MTAQTTVASEASPWGPFDLGGKSAIVTGAARGIGVAIARRLAEAGANVVVAARRVEAAQSVVDNLSGLRGSAIALECDVADEDAGERLVKGCVDAFGGVDVLVNNAGIFPYGPILELTRDDFDEVLDVNLRGLVFISQAAARRMISQGDGGVIVNVASIAGIHPTVPGYTAYAASKGGVLAATRTMALELASSNIRVVAISPGVIVGDTDPLERDSLDWLVAKVPLGRVGTYDDVAGVVVFAASSAAAFITGQNIVVEGGCLLL